ncbi:PHA/PHB synthase family protein [Nakamurella deserti]|uniref:PHA/PHB synthase family protein n=1 Tax=Nakamurella deserti TaxID=2164074 RepID=UPI000DBE0B05|nr:alpha/beta fold hydrolase [Nakamurella deserti]
MTTADKRDTPSWDPLDTRVADRLRADIIDAAAARIAKGPLGDSDAISAAPVLFKAAASLAGMPAATMKVATDWTLGLWKSSYAATARAFGTKVDGVPLTRDKRFADASWTDNAGFFWLREQFELWQKATHDLLDAADLDAKEREKARFIVQGLLDAMAPTNFPGTNPAVLKRALETNGQSLVKGLQNMVDDIRHNEGQPRQVATGVHEIGRNLGITPGKVVFRNDLMELIQYSPTTDTVHEIPLLFSPPWINKYYVMDLAPGRSLVEFAVNNGHTVFLISYRNPDESMRDVNMDDYLISGPRAALDVVTDITGAEKVNLLGLCLGGTLTMATLAYLDLQGDDRINAATFLNTLIDFSNPGALGVFTDEASVTKLEKSMRKTGFLSADSMRKTFDALRANDLIWNYVVSNWMLGQDPPAFDILTWNADSTRMPAAMHSFYLRSCYLDNRLAQGTMTLAGQQLDISKVEQDLYFLAAEQDHIAPWQSSYAGARLTAGNVRFVLSNAGHIAGIVNPPNPKSKHWVLAEEARSEQRELPESAAEWRAEATLVPTTWWLDWADWIGARAGGQVPPPPLGNDEHPVLGDAPGTYVLG